MFFSTETITVEFGCSKANRPKVLADLSADILFTYTYMISGVPFSKNNPVIQKYSEAPQPHPFQRNWWFYNKYSWYL